MGDFKNKQELFAYLASGGHVYNDWHHEQDDVHFRDGELYNGRWICTSRFEFVGEWRKKQQEVNHG